MSVPLDGNAIAGALGELFAVDVSAAVVGVWRLRPDGVVAEVVVYRRRARVVARCRGCEQVLFRLVRSETRSWFDMRGVACLRVNTWTAARNREVPGSTWRHKGFELRVTVGVV